MNRKLRVAVVFGGQSGEHEVSLMSSTSIINALDKGKYEIIMIGITRQGAWKYYDGPVENIITGEWEKSAKNLDESKYNFLATGDKAPGENIDVVFPVLHGPMGRTAPFRDCLSWPALPTWAAGFLPRRWGWIKPIQSCCLKGWALNRRIIPCS